jgi:hypothetical protein
VEQRGWTAQLPRWHENHSRAEDTSNPRHKRTDFTVLLLNWFTWEGAMCAVTVKRSISNGSPPVDKEMRGMQKGAYLELTLRSPAALPAGQIQSLAQSQLGGPHDGLNIQVLHAATDSQDPTAHHVILYVEGDQAAPDDFTKLATDVVQRSWNSGAAATAAALPAGASAVPAAQLVTVEEWEEYDHAPQAIPTMSASLAAAAPAVVAAASSGCFAPVGDGTTVGGPALAGAPVPPTSSGPFDTCPSNGDGGDRTTNALKNRDDDPAAGSWITTTVGAIVQLPVPPGLPRQRSAWSVAERAAIAQVEGLPLQVVGFLAGVRQEGPEACNCHLVSDLDDHLWLVDQQGADRKFSVVAEITPRIRANHSGWTVAQLCSLVANGTRVRVSGWLMMDPQHPDEVVGTATQPPTRGTTWEIHPILAIDVDDGRGNFVPLDDVAANGAGNGAGNGSGNGSGAADATNSAGD